MYRIFFDDLWIVDNSPEYSQWGEYVEAISSSIEMINSVLNSEMKEIPTRFRTTEKVISKKTKIKLCPRHKQELRGGVCRLCMR